MVAKHEQVRGKLKKKERKRKATAVLVTISGGKIKLCVNGPGRGLTRRGAADSCSDSPTPQSPPCMWCVNSACPPHRPKSVPASVTHGTSAPIVWSAGLAGRRGEGRRGGRAGGGLSRSASFYRYH
jgi:hypothetical protein